MRKFLIATVFLMALVITNYRSAIAAGREDPIPKTMTKYNQVQKLDHPWGFDISLRATTNSTIPFQSEQEGKEQDLGTETKIPHLVLKRNGELTPSYERTLLVSVENLSIPRSGLYLDLSIQTHHDNPDLNGGLNNKIEVWNEIRFVPYALDLAKTVEFTIQFSQAYLPQAPTVQTPTDYYDLRLTLVNSQGENLQEIEQEYAFLLENQWMVPLPKLLEASPGAAPDQLIVYFCDMFPFQRDMKDALTLLKRNEVNAYVQAELIPAMVQAIEIQSNIWNFPWYREWKNYRTDEDPNSLSVALGEYKTWYHGTSLFLGNSMISIRVDGTYGEYSSLTNGILSVFHHELFHNLQRNISLHFQGNENLSGMSDAWKMFTEGTAVLASAVGQPNVEFETALHPRSYLKRVNAFLGQEGLTGGGLNESYTNIPYHTAVFWRFLYEHCGGLTYGRENPSTGMEIIRNILEILYKGEVVDIQSSSNSASSLPKIIEHALKQTPSCEFRRYDDVLLRFSEAVFLLRTQNGRCNTLIDFHVCGFFDPHHIYPAPNSEIYTIPTNKELLIEGAIQSSYGINLIELNLDESVKQKKIKMVFENVSGIPEEFCITILRVHHLSSSSKRVTISAGESQSTCAEGGSIALEINPLSGGQLLDIGIVISRLDSIENLDTGKYSLRIQAE